MQQAQIDRDRVSDALPLTQTSGRIALRLYARPVPSMTSMSVVDGSVKLFNRQSHHYASPQDVVIRVRGVLFHAVGQLSLVSASAPVTHSALIIGGTADNKSTAATSRRRLQQLDWDDNESLSSLDRIRDDIWRVHEDSLQSWVDENHRRLQSEEDAEDGQIFDGTSGSSITSSSTSRANKVTEKPTPGNATLQTDVTASEIVPTWSDVVIPFPYVMDDSEESFRQGRTPASRRLLPQERLLESNAAHCQFEIDFQVQAEEWTVGEWRKLMRRKMGEKERLKPSSALEQIAAATTTNTREDSIGNTKVVTEPYAKRHWPAQQRRRRPQPQDEALVMVLNGTIHSEKCHFFAHVNATALRTNWEVTTSRAMNYSFYMMLVCLAQIVVLLRQLLHSQSQSAATRVSLVCVGWQTVIGGLLCLGDIYLSLAMNNLFTPFASVAFFKLLIFCVIEM